jgi:hypothetical protein
MPRLFWPNLLEMDIALKLDVPNLPFGTYAAALRWRAKDRLGLPREPFKVFRRSKTVSWEMNSLAFFSGNTTVSFPFLLEWGRTPLIEAWVTLSPNIGQTITVQAIDHRGDIIPGVTGSASRPSINSPSRYFVPLRAPNICGVLLSGGTGTVQEVTGATMEVAVNDAQWVLQETVGLPFALNEIPLGAYNTGAIQGKSNTRTGAAAALERLQEGKSIYTPPPSSRPNGATAPVWPEPTPSSFMSQLATGNNSLLAQIRQLLVDTAPGGPSANVSQVDYRRSVPVPSFRQPGQAADPNQPGRIDLGVAGLALVAAATDPWTALALGFGVTAFPKDLPTPPRLTAEAQPSLAVAGTGSTLAPLFIPAIDTDYMVTGKFRLADGTVVELAAIANLVRYAVAPPAALTATTVRRHRPMLRDQAGSEDVELRWPRVSGQLRPHQYALGIQVGNTLGVLNQPRPGSNTGFNPYGPTQRPGGSQDNQNAISFVDTARAVPLTGGRSDTYMVAAQDVFGRWSSWAEAPHAIAADPPPPPPQLLGSEFKLKSPKSGRIVGADLEVTFAWDWADRTPTFIQLFGRFFDPKAEPPTSIPSGMVHKLVPAGNEAPWTLQFSSINNPPVSFPTGGPNVVMLPVQSGDGDVRRYKLTDFFFDLDFGSASRLAYATWARIALAVNQPGPVYGTQSAPVVARAADPLPLAPPTVVPEINWTALPDAMGVARASLSFPAVPLANGYVVYEASEAAILSALGQSQPPRSGAGSSIAERAIKLKAVAGQIGATDAFARLRTDNLKSPKVEVQLPGTVDGLYAYTFTSVTGENVESPRSAATLVAIPRRVVPGAPSLRARAASGGVSVRVVPGPGPAPARVALHRTTSPAVVSDVDLMGPPVKEGAVPPWTKQPDGSFMLVDQVAPSWRPYYYRAVAFGNDDPTNGKRAGRSAPSAVMDVLVPPSTPPDLAGLNMMKSANGTLIQVQFRSSADIRVAPAGVHRVQILTVNRKGALPKENPRAEGKLPTIAARVEPPAQVAGAITRGDRDGAGRYLYECFVPFGDDELLVKLTDPLGRTSSLRSPFAPDLADLQAAASQATVTVRVKSSAPITPPPSGQHLLELLQTVDLDVKSPTTLVTSAALHTIGTTPINGQFSRSGPDAEGRFTYTCTFGFSPGAQPIEVSVRLTDPLGQRELFAPVVFGGGGTDL